jgi:hypothetical protein
MTTQDVRACISKMTTSDPVLQARVWTSLARTSLLPGDQLDALMTAVGVLEGMFLQVYVRMELGEWLVSHRFPVEVRGSVCV